MAKAKQKIVTVDTPLNPREMRFAEEFPIDLNATKAAERSGYSVKSARSKGAQLLTKINIQAAIDKAIQARSERTEITQDRVLTELALLGFANALDYMTVQKDGTAYTDLSKLTREQAAAISEITIDEYTEGRGEDAVDVKKIKLKFHDKKGALVDIGKHLGMFPIRQEHTGKDGGPIVVSFGGEDQLQDED